MDLAGRPFMRWPGGKRRLLKYILSGLPEYEVYVEPFLGGGAVFFGLAPKKAFLYDINPLIINLFNQVKSRSNDLISLMRQHRAKHCKEYFYTIRTKIKQDGVLSLQEASNFFYLIQSAYHGNYSTNKKGHCNSGFTSTPIYLGEKREKKILACSQILRQATIECKSFHTLPIKKKALYYIDPPYLGSTVTYGCKFKEDEWRCLKEMCDSIVSLGSHFILSHAKNDFISKLFKGYTQRQIPYTWAMAEKQPHGTECLYSSF